MNNLQGCEIRCGGVTVTIMIGDFIKNKIHTHTLKATNGD